MLTFQRNQLKSVVDSLKETLGERAEINERLLTRRRSERSVDEGGGGEGEGDDGDAEKIKSGGNGDGNGDKLTQSLELLSATQ